ncbi:LysR family transcriptional regulator [Streptomyces sp. SR27]|uniref:LysR family transcriptional regulator n=1 Tax=Streptomyces sp. SR27 TaxID=3076630 RepID=UPI00295B8D2C|nr:LysR family transcriptional regulator [Streptomyces sp. SR27]MDV9193486.1 LysR family transcriptional regulator [Streptomyces sp. SR27]
MELRQLRYFVAVVEEGGFTRAAARLHLAQPGVSAQIRQLERELGQRLLDRSGGTVTPTEVGEALLPYARAALAAVEGVRQVADEFGGLLRGRVTIGVAAGVAVSAVPAHPFDLAAVLADFHRRHPRIEVTLTEAASERMLSALQSGELDIALVGLAEDEPPAGVSLHVLIDEPLVAAVAADDPLAEASGPVIGVEALNGLPLICLPRGTGTRGVLEQACARAGFRPRVVFEAADPRLLAQLAARGLGVAAVPRLAEGVAEGLGLRVLHFEDPQPRARIALAWRTNGPTAPAAGALLNRLRTALAKAP